MAASRHRRRAPLVTAADAGRRCRAAREHAAVARARSACTSTSALEIMIWMMFALGYNLLLGHAGLPSFGHGAYFGVGAYAFGLRSSASVAGLLARPRRRGARGGARRRAGRRVHLAPARHLLRAADHRLRPGVLVRRDQVAQRHRRRGRPAQHQAPARCDFGVRERRASRSNEALFYFVLRDVRAGRGRAVAAGAFAVRPRAARDQAERDARRASSATTSGSTSGSRSSLSARDRRARRRPVRAGAAVGLPERDEPAQVGLRGDDGADRRRPGELLGAGDRRACSSSSRATCSAPTPRPGCSGTGCSSWRWCCSSPRASPGSGSDASCGATGR